MRILTGLRRSVPHLQRSIMSAVGDLGVTHDVAALHLDCSTSRVDFWTSEKWRAMTLTDLLGLVEVSGDAGAVLGILERACGRLSVPLHESQAESMGSLQLAALTVGSLVGRLQGEVGEALSDGELDDSERDELVGYIDELLGKLQGLRAQLTAGRLAAVSGR